MEYRRSEIRAGVFLLLAFTVVAVMVFAVSDVQSLFKKKKNVKVLFLFSDGIEVNAPVRFAGMKVGKVRDIRVAGDKIELTLSVYRDTVIRQDTKAAIKSLGLVGGKYVDLSGGSANAPLVAPGGTLVGEESFKFDDLTRAALDVVGRLKGIADNLHSILGDPKMARSLRGTVTNLEEVSGNLKVMTASKDEVAQGLKDLPKLIKQLEESTNNLKTITGKTDKILDDNKKNIDLTLQHVEALTKNLKDASEDVKSNPWKLLRKP